MAAGIEVYNPDGSLQFGIGNRLFRTLSSQISDSAAGSMTVPGASSQGTVVGVATLLDSSDDATPRRVSRSGDTINWNAGSRSKIDMLVY